MPEKFGDRDIQYENPLASYKPFDAKKEIQEIGKFSPEEEKLSAKEKRELKRQRLEEFKENFLMQKLGIAETVKILRTEIEKNPEADLEDLEDGIVAGSAIGYRFTEEQRDGFLLGLDAYKTRREAVERYREKFPDDANFYQACFGARAKGKVEVLTGPMTIFFRCYDRDDFLFVSSFYKTQGDVTKIGSEDVARSRNSGGVALRNVKIPELACVVIAENVQANTGLVNDSQRVRQHEEQHQFDKLFVPLEIKINKTEIILDAEKARDQAKTPEERVLVEDQTIDKLAKLKRIETGIDSSARSEILAYYATGESPSTILETLAKNKLYDYLQFHKDRLVDFAREINQEMFSITPFDLTDHAHEALEFSFGEKYKQELSEWIGAVSELEKKGYSREDIISILQTEPVNFWTNLARRLP